MSQQTQSRETTPGELIFACALMGFSLFIGFMAFGISGFASISSPGAIPMLAATTLIFSALWVLRDSIKQRTVATEPFMQKMMPPVVLVFGLATLVYIIAMDAAGFIISSLLYLAFCIYYLHRKEPFVTALISINSLAIIYIVFRLVFKIILPEGSLFE